MDLGILFDVVTALIGLYIICKYFIGVKKQDLKFKKLYTNQDPDLSVVLCLVFFFLFSVFGVFLLNIVSKINLPNVLYLSYDEEVTFIIVFMILITSLIISFILLINFSKKDCKGKVFKGFRLDILSVIFIHGLLASIPLNCAFHYYLHNLEKTVADIYVALYVSFFFIQAGMSFLLVGSLTKVVALPVRLYLAPDFLVTINTGGRNKEIKDKLECGLLDEKDGYLFVDKDGMVFRISTGSIIMIEPLSSN